MRPLSEKFQFMENIFVQNFNLISSKTLLFSAHDFDIDIDLNELPTPQMSSTFSSESSRTQSGSRLSLQDYKARNNM
jgi:hypothetical protein